VIAVIVRGCGLLVAAISVLSWPGHAWAGRIQVRAADPAGTAQPNVVVYAVPEGGKPRARARAGTIDQINKAFVPGVTAVQVGTPVRFPNKDNIRHHVYSFSPVKVFELKLYSGVPSKPVVFDKPGPVTLGCNIHDNMIGFVYVVDTPYFATTGVQGEAFIDDLPAGRYQVRVWHPYQRAQTAPVSVDLAQDAASDLAFRLELTDGAPPLR